jgi:hypothetical protein
MTTRAPLLLAALAGTLALGACGSGGSPGSTKSAQDKAFEGALKFAKCMRQHGVDMPDPTRSGNGGINIQMGRQGGGKIRTNDPSIKAAQSACQKYLQTGGGRAPSPAERARMQAAMLAYTHCMRSHGVKMADPKFSGGGVSMEVGGPGQTRPDSPLFKAADQACHGKLGKGKTGAPSFGTQGAKG